MVPSRSLEYRACLVALGMLLSAISRPPEAFGQG